MSLRFGTLLIAGSVLFPVWKITYLGNERQNFRASLYAVGKPYIDDYINIHHQPYEGFDPYRVFKARIDYKRMGIECGLIILLTFAAVLLLKDGNDRIVEHWPRPDRLLGRLWRLFIRIFGQQPTPRDHKPIQEYNTEIDAQGGSRSKSEGKLNFDIDGLM